MSDWKKGFDDGSGAEFTEDEGGYITNKDGDVIVRGGGYEGLPIGVLRAEHAALICAAPLIPECEDKFELALPRLKNLCKYLTADSAEYKITQMLISEIYDILTALKAARGSDD